MARNPLRTVEQGNANATFYRTFISEDFLRNCRIYKSYLLSVAAFLPCVV
jgi:hypothetical protein